MFSRELVPALVAESARKSRVCWLTWTDANRRTSGPRLVWHAWYDGALLVVSGDAGQELPGLAQAAGVEVTMRSKDTGGRLLTWPGAVQVVDPEDASWDGVAGALLGVRLNLPDPAATAARWRSAATVLRVVPVEAAGEPDSGPLP